MPPPTDSVPFLGNRFATTETPTATMDNFTWTWQESLLVIPLGLIVIGTIIGNSLVLYAAATRSQTLRLPTHYLIANLSLADFLVGVLVMPFLTVLQITGKWYFGSMYCESWTVIHFWLCSASILSTCAVCIERYIGVRFPLKHKSIMNSRRIWGMISCVWTLAGLLSFGSLYIWPQPKSGIPYTCDINQQIGHVIMAVVGILYVPAVIMIILYIKIYIIATRHLKFMKKNSSVGILSSSDSLEENSRKGLTNFFRKKPNNSEVKKLASILEPDSSTSDTSIGKSSPRGSEEDLGESSKNQARGNLEKKESDFSEISTASTTTMSNTVASSNTSGSTTNWNISLVKNVQSKKQINLAKRLSLLVGILLATYLPFFTLYLIMAFYPGSINIQVFQAFGWIRYFNSCINPFIYALAVPAYRKAMLGIISNGFGKLQIFSANERL